MAKTFTFPLTTTADDMLAQASKAAHDVGAVFQGDAAAGTFEAGGVEGTYKVIGNEVSITIADKPFFVPWSMVEEKLKEFFT